MATSAARTLILVLSLTVGCTAASEQAPGPAGPDPRTSAPVPGPRTDAAAVVLDVPVGTAPDLPGRTAPAPGGTLSRGPSTFAIDAAGRVWLFDVAKQRLTAYEGPRLVQAVPLDQRTFAALLVIGPFAYLREADDVATIRREIEVSLPSGSVVREADPRTGAPSLYPRDRRPWPFLMDAVKGVPEVIGRDAVGNTYDRESRLQVNAGEPAGAVRRVDPVGHVLAVGYFALGTARPHDYFLAEDGSLFQLDWIEGPGGVPQRVVVTRVLDPR